MRMPRLRPGVGAGIDSEGHLRVIFFSQSRHVVYAAEPPVIDAVKLLIDGTETDAMLDELRSAHPGFTRTDLDEILAALDGEGALDDAAAAPTTALDELELVRYGRQIDLFHDFTGLTEARDPDDHPADGSVHPVQAQRRLRRATVTVIGVGGTGTWMAQSLALTGIGHLRLVDPDVVELSNLSRQVLYSAEDLGLPKAETAARRLNDVTGSGVRVTAVGTRLGPDTDLDTLLAGSDLVVNCADEPDINTTARWVSRSCTALGIPHIVGGAYAGHVGMIGPTIVPGSTACWTCYERDNARRGDGGTITPLSPHRDRHTAAFAPLSAIVANLQTWDAVRVLSGIAPPLLANRLGELDLRTMRLDWREVPQDPDCPACGGPSDDQH
jgi:bacteriocin biosynthesis cyclodehydratase domain-containing protein